MKLNFTRLIPTGALLCLLLASCKKNDATNSPSSQTNPQLVQTTTMIGASDNETNQEVLDALSSDGTNTTVDQSDCPISTFSPSKGVYPHIRIIDYGSGCTDTNGITRSGKRFITVYASQKTASAGAVLSVSSFSNYYVDGVNISGSVRLSVVNPAVPGPLVLKTEVSKTITDTYGNTSTEVSTSIHTQTGGDVNSAPEDKAFTITENAYGTEVDGDSTIVTWKYVTDPSNSIIKYGSCAFPTQGALQITLKQNGVENHEYLDYGNGDCDRNATLSVNNGAPQPVTLPFEFYATHL